MFALTTIAVFVMLSALNGVMAGAGANIQACVKFQRKPLRPFQVTFDPLNSQNKCMNDVGSVAKITVTSSELTCVSIGYVESKTSSSGGDFCATADSLWFLSYKTSGLSSEKSGTAKSQWFYSWINPNIVELKSYPRGTHICGSDNLCDGDSFSWPNGTPTAWIIFEPDTPKLLSSDADTQIVMGEA